MQDVLHPISQTYDVPEYWRLEPVRQDVWAAIWSPVHDMRIQHPRSFERMNFTRGVARGEYAGMRYATGWQLNQHSNHKLSARLGVVSISRVLAGYATMDFELKSFVLRPGQILINDHLQNYRGSQHEMVGETIYVPRHLLGLPEGSATGPILIEEGTLFGETLSQEMTRFFDLPESSDFDADTLLHAANSVIVHNRHLVSERAGWWRARNEIIRKYIESNLGDQTLLPSKICNVFNLSRATLYRMFEADGGVRRYIQDRRLHVAIWDLADGGIKRGRLTHLSEKWGFSSNANFNRAVKQAFSMPPGSLFAEGAYVPPARFGSMREAFPTFDWFVRLSETASLRRLRD
ncbi:MAG: helix-turn-helix transcriptional regulator [Henriciella sp.]|nr:helix-turn-helix transcriptional regulator [Henriciella sp.]